MLKLYGADATGPGRNVPKLPEINDPQLGDVVVFPGHIGMYLSDYIYISARTAPLSGNVPDRGVQITSYPYGKSTSYRRFVETDNRRRTRSAGY